MTTLKAAVGDSVFVVVGSNVGVNVGAEVNSCSPEEENKKVYTNSADGKVDVCDWPLTVAVMMELGLEGEIIFENIASVEEVL
jgi:hypothetical protein